MEVGQDLEGLLRELENAVLSFSRAATIEECRAQAERISAARIEIQTFVVSETSKALKAGHEAARRLATRHAEAP